MIPHLTRVKGKPYHQKPFNVRPATWALLGSHSISLLHRCCWSGKTPDASVSAGIRALEKQHRTFILQSTRLLQLKVLPKII